MADPSGQPPSAPDPEPDPDPADRNPELLAGLATTRAIRRYTDDPDPRRRPARQHPVARVASAERIEPPAVPLPRAARRADRAVQARRRCSASRSDAAGTASEQPPTATPRRSTAAPSTRRRPAPRRRCSTSSTTSSSVPVVVLVCLERYRDPNAYEGGSVYPACAEPAARGAGARLRRCAHHVAPRGRGRTARAARDPGSRRPLGVHHARSAGGPPRSGRRRPIGELVYDGRWGTPAAWAVDPDGTRHTRWIR
jgi:hypothetical protein